MDASRYLSAAYTGIVKMTLGKSSGLMEPSQQSEGNAEIQNSGVSETPSSVLLPVYRPLADLLPAVSTLDTSVSFTLVKSRLLSLHPFS